MGGGSDSGPFGKVRPEPAGESSKNELPPPRFLKLEREAPVWTLLVVF